MQDKIFWRLFAKRGAICFFVIILLLFSCILRVAVIATSNYSEVQKNQSSLRLKVHNTRGTIFDYNNYPITNNKKKIIAAISPTPRAITAISTVLKDDELMNILKVLKKGKPVITEVPRKINCEGIICKEVYYTDNNIPAIHTIGYTDSDNNGVSGLEKAYNDILRNNPLTIRYACDGKGRVLSGIEPEIQNEASYLSNGIVTTIDINIQKITDNYASFLGSGAIIVADAKNSKIRGISSVPSFTTNTVSEVLNDSATPLYNRALGAYNVGSAFKPCVSAAGLEDNKGDFIYNCKGSFNIIDRVFKCHEIKGHGYVDLNQAIAHSCNTFFNNFICILINSIINIYIFI